MIIDELRVNGFGKWRNTNFHFAPGLNLFVAPNEVGKTTLLHALIASLYGMKRDYVRVTRYLDDYEKYLPWDRGSYETIVRYTLQGQIYRLHRHLEKEREQTKLFREPELLDMTAQYHEDRRREFNFIERHIGLNRTLFTDVTWVKREPISAAEHLVPQLMKHETGDPVAKQILTGLEQELTAIGKKETAENTLLGKISKQFVQTGQELDHAEKAWESVKDLTSMVVTWQEEWLTHEKQKERYVTKLQELYRDEQETQRLWQKTYELTYSNQLTTWIEKSITTEEKELHVVTKEQLAQIEEREHSHNHLQRAQNESAAAEQKGDGIFYLRFADITEEDWQTWLKGWYTIVAYDQQQAAMFSTSESHIDVDLLQATYRNGWNITKKLEEHRQTQYHLMPKLSQAEKACHAQENKQKERENHQEELLVLQKEEEVLLHTFQNLSSFDEDLALEAKFVWKQQSSMLNQQTIQQSENTNVTSRQHRRTTQEQLKRKTYVSIGGSVALLFNIFTGVAITLGWTELAWLGGLMTLFAVVGTVLLLKAIKKQLKHESTILTPTIEMGEHLRIWLEQMNIHNETELDMLHQAYKRWKQLVNKMKSLKDSLAMSTDQDDLELPVQYEDSLSVFEKLQYEWNSLQNEISECEATLAQLILVWQVETWDEFLAIREKHLSFIHRQEMKKQEAEEITHLQTQLEAQMLRWGVPPHLSCRDAAPIVLQERAEWERRTKEDQRRLQDELTQERLRAQMSVELEQLAKEKEQILHDWEEQIRLFLQLRQKEVQVQRKELDQKLQEHEQRILELREWIARAQGEIGQRDEVSWAKTKSAHLEATRRMEELLLRRDALQLARESLQEVLDEWHREISPDVNEAASSITSLMTNGRYQDVRLDPLQRFAVRVIEPTRQEVVQHEQLSTGTQDQLYFAQRIAFLRHLSTEKEALPLFLDDHFIHYDDVRLQKTLAFLLDLANEHQIFLFSCQEREKDYLEPFLHKNARHRIQQLSV